MTNMRATDSLSTSYRAPGVAVPPQFHIGAKVRILGTDPQQTGRIRRVTRDGSLIVQPSGIKPVVTLRTDQVEAVS